MPKKTSTAAESSPEALPAKKKIERFLEIDAVELTEDDWLVPATDNRGHSAKMQFRVPPHIARCVQEIVQNPRLPFRTDDDFLRFSVWLCVRLLQQKMDAISPNVLIAADAVVRVVRDHEQAQSIYEAVRMSVAMCEKLVADGDVQGVHSRIAYIDAVIAQLSPTSRWRRQFSESWKTASQKYRDWVKQQMAKKTGSGAGRPNRARSLEIHEMLSGDEEHDQDQA